MEVQTVLLATVLLFAICYAAEYQEIYIRSILTQPCPQGHHCHTLLSYFLDSKGTFVSNATLHFLPGTHSAVLPQPRTLFISNVSNLLLTGPHIGPDDTPLASIYCDYTMQFRIAYVRNLTLRMLEIKRCGFYDYEIQWIYLISAPSALVLYNIDFVLVQSVYILYSQGSGLVVADCSHSISIKNSRFSHNCEKVTTTYTAGNLILGFDFIDEGRTEVEITNSQLSNCQTEQHDHSGGLNIFVNATEGYQNFTLSISNCSFFNNTGTDGGNMLVYTIHKRESRFTSIQIHLQIHNCHFTNGKATNGGGLALSYYPLAIHIFCSISNTTFIGNRAMRAGGAFCIKRSVDYVKPDPYHWKEFLTTFIYIDNCIYEDNYAQKGGAISILRPVDVNDAYLQPYHMMVTIANSVYFRNYALRSHGGAVDISMFLIEKFSKGSIMHMHMKNCTVEENYSQYGAGLSFMATTGGFLQPCPTKPQPGCFSTIISLHLTGCHFLSNRADFISSIHVHIVPAYVSSHISIGSTTFFNNGNFLHIHYATALIYLANVNGTVSNSLFLNNNGSCIVANQSVITLHGHVDFINNTAYAGAALLLDCSLDTRQPSFLVLLPDAAVSITNNTALYYGGGIAVNPVCDYTSSCFFQASSPTNAAVYLRDNKGFTANSIYGPTARSCDNSDEELGWHTAFKAIFHVKEGYSLDQVVLAPVYSVCFCNNSLELGCSTEFEVSVWSGEEFTVSTVGTVGIHHTSSTFIRASLTEIGGYEGQLGNRRLQKIQEMQQPCDQLTYSVFTSANTTQIKLQIDSVFNTLPSFINVSILQCPLGFKFAKEHSKCICYDYLIEQIPEIICTIENGEIRVPGSAWIGNYSDRLAAHRHCPLDYCNPNTHSIDLQQQHLQCTHNRSGVLCGACHTGYSLSLGTTHCLESCSNYYLFLIIPFTLAGLAIVFLLLICNLNVSVGSTSALIFYANIIHVNETIFFPQNKHFILTNMLQIFIAWLNLDFGIQICFHTGMTAYGYTWLQFVFPVYIWMLVLVMIFGSRYSITVSKIIGRNAVSVLGTLFLLSFAKLLRTVIAVVTSISLEDEDEKEHLLWRMDANVPYFSTRHTFLFIAALLAVLFYIIPLTLLTLLAPYLQARTNHPLMRWVVRLKPFLDAYQGPYKDSFRYWMGVMFLQRIVLFTVFAANTRGNPNINLLAISVCTVLTHLWQLFLGRIYKNSFNWLLEGFYSGNLAIFTSATFFLDTSQGSSESLVCAMVGSACVVFCLIILWHFNQQTRATSKTAKKLKQLLKGQKIIQAHSTQNPTSPPPSAPQPTVSVIDMRVLREPLLTDN